MTTAGWPTPGRDDKPKNLWLKSDTSDLVASGLVVIFLSFVSAMPIWFVYLWLAPSGWATADPFKDLWWISFFIWAWVMKSSLEDTQREKLAKEKTANEAAIVERLKQEAKARDERLEQEAAMALYEAREKIRLEGIELERQQGIYVQNRMNERMREKGLPRMAADAFDFELLAAQWIHVWGDRDVEVTQQSRDGGIDVRSWCCLGQVKFYSNGKVPATEVHALKGAASVDNSRFAIVFAFSTGYTNDAINFADDAGVALFQFDVRTLTFLSVNAQAETVLNHLHSLL